MNDLRPLLAALPDANPVRQLLYQEGWMEHEVKVYDVSADVGNARTVVLVREPATGKVVGDVRFPSIKSLRGASSRKLFSQRGLPADAWAQLRPDDHILSVDGIERYVGTLAAEQASVADAARGSDERYHDGFVNDFILAGLAAALPRETTITARLVIVAPAELWALVQEKVAATLRRSFAYCYNGRAITVTFNEVLVLREGHAAWYALPEAQRSGRTLIIDGGGRTFNVVALNEGQISAAPKTLELGVEGVLDDVDEVLIERGARALTLAERLALQDALRDDQPFAITSNGVRVLVKPSALARFDAAATSFVQVLKARVPLGMADNLWLVGGAAYFMGKQMQAHLPTLRIPDAPEAMNAYGALACLADAPVKKARVRK